LRKLIERFAFQDYPEPKTLNQAFRLPPGHAFAPSVSLEW
jgi:hypothetical protein